MAARIKQVSEAGEVLSSASTPGCGFHQLLVKPVGERCHLEHSHARGTHMATEFADLIAAPAYSG